MLETENDTLTDTLPYVATGSPVPLYQVSYQSGLSSSPWLLAALIVLLFLMLKK